MGSLFSKLTNVSDGGKSLPWISRKIMAYISGYDHQKYWSRRSKVINPNSSVCKLLKMYYLLWIKKVDKKQHCSFGTSYNTGSQFVTPPILPHGPNGIIVGDDVKVGRECIIYHQVTIAAGNVSIGDRTLIGAGAKIMSNVHIGNQCRVGANAVVVEDMPDYSTCVMQKPRIIIKKR